MTPFAGLGVVADKRGMLELASAHGHGDLGAAPFALCERTNTQVTV